MTRSLFERLRQLNLGSQDYAIFGSGPLAIRGIIPFSNDLDVLCQGATLERVKQIAKLEFFPEYNVSLATLPDCDITFGIGWAVGNFDINELINTAEIIEGLPFVKLKYVAEYKRIWAREKDIEHLKMLEISGYMT